MSDFEVLDVISTKGKKNNIRILKAKLLSTDEIVCLKTFKSHKFSAVQEALHEAKILMSASAHHQNICKMHDCFIEQLQEHFRFGIVMQHFDLGDLEDEIKRRKRANRPWREQELTEIFLGILDALSVLQKNQICHRDLKPQNIFMQSSLHYKIGDFGLSKKEGLGRLSLSKSLVGTPIYFSPLCARAYLQYELLGGEVKVKHNMYKSDVFSLGLTFLRMASLSSIRGLNCSTQETIMKRIGQLGYGEQVRGMLYHMLQLEEVQRPDFVVLPAIYQELECVLMYTQPAFVVAEEMGDEANEEIVFEELNAEDAESLVLGEIVESELRVEEERRDEEAQAYWEGCGGEADIWDLETEGSVVGNAEESMGNAKDGEELAEILDPDDCGMDLGDVSSHRYCKSNKFIGAGADGFSPSEQLVALILKPEAETRNPKLVLTIS